ncbi:MAG: MCE family protein [Rickettsia sp.]|nr:MCE family protein [Rickettsia sp.]
MVRYSFFEIFIGIFILTLSFVALIYFFSVKKISNRNFSTYMIKVDFSNVDGISVNSDVQISGVRVGYVQKIQLEDDFYVSLELAIKKNIKIPEDSRANITSSSLFSPKHLSIDPGSSKKILENGQKIVFSNVQLGLDDLINKIIYAISLRK